MTYTLTRINAPTADVVSLDEVQAQARIDFADEDSLLARYIATATQWLDGTDGYLGRALITQTWRITFDRFDLAIALPLPPCQSVDAFNYLDAGGVTQTIAPSVYTVTGIGAPLGAKIKTVGGASWPATIGGPECVSIDFTAGYGDAPADVPEPIRAAIITYVSQLYGNREAPSDPPADMVQAYRVWTF